MGQTPTSTQAPARPTSRHRAADCRLDDLLRILAEGTRAEDYPHAARIEQGVVVYDAANLRSAIEAEGGDTEAIEAELVHAWAQGPGIVVFTGAFAPEVLDRVTDAFGRIITQEKTAGGPRGDHFGTPGMNDRIWNAQEKLAVADPAAYVDYYANDLVALASHAWLGPGYQVTAQPNVVRPGAKGQTVHRDYHLGFMDDSQAAAYPKHAHALSPVLTLQGAIAHVDMPLESGPTLYLPHSQKYDVGYLAYWLPEFQEYFVAHHIQLPLSKGDLVFFNPALFHAAGSNTSTDIQRVANLLQVSSAFGRAMDAVDRARLVRAIYPTLLSRKGSRMPAAHLSNVVAASAEGYAFPTNLDRDQPVGSMAPPTQADLLREALAGEWDADRFGAALDAHAERRVTH